MFSKAKGAGEEKDRQGQPLAYQTGVQNFYGRDFLVTPDVLIPRPETEQMIDAVLNLVGKPYLPGVKPSVAKIGSKNLQILDVGTGSGCIAITLKLELPEARVQALDISPAAILVAQKNAAKYGTPIPFIISNLLENVKFTPDLIVANLPYVDPEWDWLDRQALEYEPAISLYAKNHGLALILDLIKQASRKGVKYLILEADPCEHAEIEKFAKSQGFKLIETRGFILTLYSPRG